MADDNGRLRTDTRVMTLRRRLLLSILVVGLRATACSAGDADEITASTTTTTSSTTEAASPTWSLDARFGQVVGWLNGEPFDEALFIEDFGEAFRQQITYEELAELGASFVASGPWRPVSEERSEDGFGLVARLTPADAGGDLEVMLIVGADDQAPIETLLFVPAVEVEPAADVDEAVDALAALGEVAVGAFAISGGGCGAPILDRGVDLQAPIGSAFKLWVLVAIVDAVAQGSITWEDEIAIDDDLDSLPSGITQDEPDGSTVAVRELAERMISISDNTATDVLIDLVGRDAVEAALVAGGHTAPELNRPLLTTRELFVLKLDGQLRETYLAADEGGRRELLAGPVAEVDVLALAATADRWTGPIEVETLEWFASPADLCRILTVLAADDEARGVLSLNPGLPDEQLRWSFIGFKGGSEPGVLNLSWVVEEADGISYVVTGSVWNTESLLDETAAAIRLGEVRDLIGR